jgi:regulator of protease activity HflC (stomatin/prohibitin superfamily)
MANWGNSSTSETLGCCNCISSSDIAIVERLEKYQTLKGSGLTCMLWPIEQIKAVMSLRVQMMYVRIESKTKDDVFCTIQVAVMYRVLEEKAAAAYYKLSDVRGQISSYVNNTIRSILPKFPLDDLFLSKDDIARDTKVALDKTMNEFGYEIVTVLITDLDPDRKVKDSMNQQQQQRKLREAAAHKAEADKILLVKAAEAEADAKYLSGTGVARQRKALMDGLRATVDEYTADVEGLPGTDVLDLLLVTQYFDTMKEITSKTGSTSTIFMKHTPTAVADLREDLKAKFMTGKGR